MRLEDLRIIIGHAPDTRPATLEEVVEVLKQEGAETRQWYAPMAFHPKGRPDLGDDLPAGRYLVYRLEGEK